MGPRVRVVLLVLSLVAVAALAIPLALSLADRRTSELATERGRQLSAMADAAAVPDAPLQRLVDRYFEVYDEGLVIVDSDGRSLASRGLGTDEPGVARSAGNALVDAPESRWTRILPWDSRRILTATGVRNRGELVGAVVMDVDTRRAARDIAVGWAWIALGVIGLLALASVVAHRLIRWVLRPLNGLERAVDEMTEGVAGPPADVAGPPELRHFTTAFNKMAATVRASLERQKRLIADTSHQLRNPLAAVRLRADTLENYISEDGRTTYTSMTAELDRFEKLLAQLMRLARAEQISGSRQAGISDTAMGSTDLGDVIAERIAFWRPVADRGGQRLQDDSGRTGLTVSLPRHEIEQLLDVAIDNALRYAGKDITVNVSVDTGDDTVDLIVSDDGRGLADEELTKAAGRFWRARDDGSGTGLGLAIAAEIVAGHGGMIAVENAPQGGLLVRYRLPIVQEAV